MNNHTGNYPDKIKASFAPISNQFTQILILGTLPGEKSLEQGEYYAHPQNRFWRILSQITSSRLPVNYREKCDLLLSQKIGVWDVVREAKRNGSLDSKITDEIPNDLDNFVEGHQNLKIIAFNGSKAEKLFDKYFERRAIFEYLSLPSSSPANARINFEEICKRWRKMFN